MQYQSMLELYTNIADALHHDPVQSRRGSGEPIYPGYEAMVADQRGSYLDISVLYGVSPKGFYYLLWMVLESLVLHPCLHIQEDMQPAALAQTASRYLE